MLNLRSLRQCPAGGFSFLAGRAAAHRARTCSIGSVCVVSRRGQTAIRACLQARRYFQHKRTRRGARL